MPTGVSRTVDVFFRFGARGHGPSTVLVQHSATFVPLTSSCPWGVGLTRHGAQPLRCVVECPVAFQEVFCTVPGMVDLQPSGVSGLPGRACFGLFLTAFWAPSDAPHEKETMGPIHAAGFTDLGSLLRAAPDQKVHPTNREGTSTGSWDAVARGVGLLLIGVLYKE